MIRTIIVAALTAAVALMHVSAGTRDARLCGWGARVGKASLESAGCPDQRSGVSHRRDAPFTLSLQTPAGVDLTQARYTWEGSDQQAHSNATSTKTLKQAVFAFITCRRLY
jgi:hypothetical protein